jgi:hypothetical protein
VDREIEHDEHLSRRGAEGLMRYAGHLAADFKESHDWSGVTISDAIDSALRQISHASSDLASYRDGSGKSRGLAESGSVSATSHALRAAVRAKPTIGDEDVVALSRVLPDAAVAAEAAAGQEPEESLDASKKLLEGIKYDLDQASEEALKSAHVAAEHTAGQLAKAAGLAFAAALELRARWYEQ